VHLNPVGAGLLKSQDRLRAYPWTSLVWYGAAREHRPIWLRVDRLLGEHGIGEDTAVGREEFERRMEGRRAAEEEEEALAPIRRGWCLGSEEFKRQMLERMEGRLGEHHAGELRREQAEGRAEGIVAEEFAGAGLDGVGFGLPAQGCGGQVGSGRAAEAGDDDAAEVDCGASAFGDVQDCQQQPAPLDEGQPETRCGGEPRVGGDQGGPSVKNEPNYGLTPFMG